ncbi:MAG: hypothetical protein IKY63_02165, partial [Tidjanibacter sp.]|nr:hypothetical protein [Tidjanibacter sp.]
MDHVKAMLVPTASDTLQDKMPPFATGFDQEAMRKQAQSMLPNGTFVDVSGVLKNIPVNLTRPIRLICFRTRNRNSLGFANSPHKKSNHLWLLSCGEYESRTRGCSRTPMGILLQSSQTLL